MIVATISGEGAVVARLAKTQLRVPESLAHAVQVETLDLVGYVKREKLSGQVLKNRTGRLRRSINGKVTRTPTAVSGRVGTNVTYGAAQEHGFNGVVSVREHLRTVTQAFGRRIAPVEATVHAFDRHMHLPARSYLRSALRERTPKIQAAMDAAVAAAVQP